MLPARHLALGSCALLLAACSSSEAPSTAGGGGPDGAALPLDGNALVPSDATFPDGSRPDASVLGGDASSSRDATAAQDAQRPGDAAPSYRNPLVQPFASTSIWNLPIRSAAAYVPARIVIPTANTLKGDEDVIVLSPTSPATPIYRNTADWNANVSRCPYDAGALLYSVPLPASFVVGDTPVSDTPNSALAVLLADGRTIKQNQPFARCTAGAPATSDDLFPDVDLYGDGTAGAHGGSWLSAIGGTLRVGELRPGTLPPRHALKLELYAAQNYYNDGQQADCYRWPATTCDGYFNDSSSALKYGGTNSALRPGSLLALPASVSIASLGLTTEPAQSLAWTLQNYGAYLVDDSAWSSASICVENGPAGSFNQQFETDWGFALDTNGTTSAFAKDIAAILGALSVVDDNAAGSVGGGGTPLQPVAPPLAAGGPADD
jgi:hypothetical protein